MGFLHAPTLAAASSGGRGKDTGRDGAGAVVDGAPDYEKKKIQDRDRDREAIARLRNAAKRVVSSQQSAVSSQQPAASSQ